MKPSNFPARKLKRQAKAQGKSVSPQQVSEARSVRTKKNRSGKARIR